MLGLIKIMSPKLNPCRKSKQRHDKEYIAIRQGEPLPPTFCEEVAAYWAKNHRWVIGYVTTTIIAVIGLYIAHLKLVVEK
jgi:hypothetical protein